MTFRSIITIAAAASVLALSASIRPAAAQSGNTPVVGKTTASPCKGIEQNACTGACQWHPELTGTIEITGKPYQVHRKAFCSLNQVKAAAELSRQNKVRPAGNAN